MTIQQGTTPYVYPQSDAALPTVFSNMSQVRSSWGPRAYMRSRDVVNPFKSMSPYILQGITVLELTDRYTGHLPYFPPGAAIKSESFPAAKECARVTLERAAAINLAIQQSEHREGFGEAYFLSLFGLGQSPISVTKVTPQSIVEHYLFNKKPIAENTDRLSALNPDYQGLEPTDTAGLEYFKNLMRIYDVQNWDLDYYYSTQPALATHLFADWPAIPKVEKDLMQLDYNIEAMIQHYHGLFNAMLSGVDRTYYIGGNWFARVQTLVRSAVYCQYFWSVRMLLNYPSIVIEMPMITESGNPILWEDGRKLMTEGYRVWE